MGKEIDVEKLEKKADIIESVSYFSYLVLTITLIGIWIFSRSSIASFLLIMILTLSAIALITNLIAAVLYDRVKKIKEKN